MPTKDLSYDFLSVVELGGRPWVDGHRATPDRDGRATAVRQPHVRETAVARPASDIARLFLFRHLLSPLQTMRFREWLKILVDNRFAVGRQFWPRAGFMTATSLVNSLMLLVEEMRFGSQLSGVRFERPLFTLGQYWSGTIFLLNLISQDPRLTHPNRYQSFFFHIFLSTESWLAPLLTPLLVRSRVQGDVRLGMTLPRPGVQDSRGPVREPGGEPARRSRSDLRGFGPRRFRDGPGVDGRLPVADRRLLQERSPGFG